MYLDISSQDLLQNTRLNPSTYIQYRLHANKLSFANWGVWHLNLHRDPQSVSSDHRLKCTIINYCLFSLCPLPPPKNTHSLAHHVFQLHDRGYGGILAGCGYRNEKCLRKVHHQQLMTTVTFVSVLLICRRWAERTVIRMGPTPCSTIRCRRAASERPANSGSLWPPQLVSTLLPECSSKKAR